MSAERAPSQRTVAYFQTYRRTYIKLGTSMEDAGQLAAAAATFETGRDDGGAPPPRHHIHPRHFIALAGGIRSPGRIASQPRLDTPQAPWALSRVPRFRAFSPALVRKRRTAMTAIPWISIRVLVP